MVTIGNKNNTDMTSSRNAVKALARHTPLFSLLLLLLCLLPLTCSAQSPMTNTAFHSGEILTYNLYYNWKFVWVKVGNATMSTINSRYNGGLSYRTSLITRGNAKADKFFIMRDTLLTYCTGQLIPQYYRKGAHEGDRYTVDEVFYSHSGNNATLKQHRQANDGKHYWRTVNGGTDALDMIIAFLRARSFDPSGWKKGYEYKFHIADGNSLNPAKLRYGGKENIKADNGHTYRCLKLSYYENEGKGYKEIVRFYVTDDANHIPVRLDMFLRFGSAKAFLVSMKGNRHAVSAKVK